MKKTPQCYHTIAVPCLLVVRRSFSKKSLSSIPKLEKRIWLYRTNAIREGFRYGLLFAQSTQTTEPSP